MKKPDAGMSLLEVLVAVSILGISVAVFSSFFSNTFLFQSNEKIKNSKSRIVDMVREEITSPGTLAHSLTAFYGVSGFDGNTAMADCLNPTKLCSITRPGAQATFQLIRRVKNGVSFTNERIAGTSAIPQYYTSNGEPQSCAPGRNCPFAVRAFFWASCSIPSTTPGVAPPATCNRPEVINVRFQLSQSYNPDLLPVSEQAARSLRFSSVPPGIPGSSPNAFADNPGEFAFSVAAKDILLRSADSCQDSDPNSIQSGVGKDGKINCICKTSEIPGSRAADPLGLNRPKCTGKSCTGSQVLVGFEVNPSTGASEPKCETPRECCWRQPYADSGDASRKGGQGPGYSSGIDCGMGGRVAKMSYGYCEVGRRKKETQDAFSYCVGSDVVCCRDVMFFDPNPSSITTCNAAP